MLSKDEVLKVANLAQLKLTDEELIKYQESLSNILTSIDVIVDIPSGSDEELRFFEYSESDLSNDDIQNSELLENIMKNTPHKKGSFIETVGVKEND